MVCSQRERKEEGTVAPFEFEVISANIGHIVSKRYEDRDKSIVRQTNEIASLSQDLLNFWRRKDKVMFKATFKAAFDKALKLYEEGGIKQELMRETERQKERDRRERERIQKRWMSGGEKGRVQMML